MSDPPERPAPIGIVALRERFVVVSKPPGLAVHRGSHARRGEEYVLQRLAAQLGRRVWPVHRLDRATSGLLVFAFAAEDVAPLQAAMEGRPKRYLAFVRGAPPEEFASDRPLGDARGRRKPTSSRFRVLARSKEGALLEATITTGRHHQIRRHLNHLAHHVAGDTTHGKGAFNRRLRAAQGLPRLFLHAWAMDLDDPFTTDRLELRDPLPEDLVRVLARLEDLRPEEGLPGVPSLEGKARGPLPQLGEEGPDDEDQVGPESRA